MEKMPTELPEKMMLMEKVRLSLFFTVWGYCMGRQLISIYFAWVEMKKIRRELNNSYMNLLVSHQEAIAYEESMA